MRHAELASREGDRGETETGGDHLDQRERDRVVVGREALQEHDLQRVGGRAAQDE